MPEIPDAGLDLLVIGGGPAGLSAARTAARLGLRTLLLEKLPRPGELAHPCGGVIAPVPGFVSGQRTSEGLCFPELDLMIPAALVMGHLSVSRYVSPGGRTFAATFPQRDDFPIAAVDKSALLRLLAGEAAAAGAELRWGTTVTDSNWPGSASRRDRMTIPGGRVRAGWSRAARSTFRRAAAG